MTRLWEPWVYWAYGAGFDRETEKHVPEAGLQLRESRFVADELIKLLGAVVSRRSRLRQRWQRYEVISPTADKIWRRG
jgi:hypothetical protein